MNLYGCEPDGPWDWLAPIVVIWIPVFIVAKLVSMLFGG